MRNRELNILTVVIFALATTLFCCAGKREDVAKYAPIESYPEDAILKHITNRKAMLVTAHDDDMCGMSGTISKLNRAGWEIKHIVLSGYDSKRRKAHINAGKFVLDTIMYMNILDKCRNDLDTVEQPYRAIPKEQFSTLYNYPMVEPELIRLINDFSPSVLFSMDNEIGGYGHPDHVFISQLVLDLAKAKKIDPEYIYQGVGTDHMEQSIIGERHSGRMKKWGFAGDDWEHAKNTYSVSGMPEPDVQINILSEAEVKMNYLMSYEESEQQKMGFMIPAFFEYQAEEYFKIFDREFFRVIKIN
jgi:LmbE family N-acetylglucosaminyl deacetylase